MAEDVLEFFAALFVKPFGEGSVFEILLVWHVSLIVIADVTLEDGLNLLAGVAAFENGVGVLEGFSAVAVFAVGVGVVVGPLAGALKGVEAFTIEKPVNPLMDILGAQAS